MLLRHHGTQRWFQTSAASRHKQWQELLKPHSRVCVLGTSHSLIPLRGCMGAFDLLLSFWGAVCHVQGTHVAPRHAKFRRFCVLSWWNLLSVLEGTPWVCVQYSSNIVESWNGQAGPSKNSTLVQRRKIPACQSLKKTSYERQKKSSKTR